MFDHACFFLKLQTLNICLMKSGFCRYLILRYHKMNQETQYAVMIKPPLGTCLKHCTISHLNRLLNAD